MASTRALEVADLPLDPKVVGKELLKRPADQLVQLRDREAGLVPGGRRWLGCEERNVHDQGRYRPALTVSLNQAM